MTAGRQILKNAGALTAARGVTAVVTLVTTVYLARVLEPAGYGILNWGLALLAYFSFAGDLGLGVYSMREVARAGERARTLVGPVLTLRVSGALMALALFLGVVALLDEGPQFKLVLAVLGLTLIAHAIEVGWVYHGLQRLSVVAVRNVATAVVTLVGVLLLVRRPDQIALAAAVMVASIALPNGWLLITYGREFGRPRLSVDRALWWSMLVPALPIAASHLLGTINTNLDQVMLGFMRTEAEVGQYAAAYRLLMAATIPWQIALQAFMPTLSNAVGNMAAMREHGGSFATALFSLGLPIAAGGAILAPELIALFGSDYAVAAGALSVLMVSVGVTYAKVTFGGALVAWDRQRSYAAALAAGAGLNVVLNVVLIPTYGIEGAAAATLFSEATVCIGVAVVYRGMVGRLFVGALARAAAATLLGVVIPLLGGAALGAPLALRLVAAAAGYAVCAWAFGLLPASTLKSAWARLSRR